MICLGQPTADLEATPRQTPLMPPSPVAFFRELLEQDDGERARMLASRSDPQRRSIAAKLAEYEVLPPAEREMRLLATEFRWYLRPLLHVAGDRRAQGIAEVPDLLRPLVEQRLAVWDRLTPRVREEFLESGWALEYFLRLEAGSAVEQERMKDRLIDPGSGRVLEREFARWQGLPPHRRQRMAEHFEEFFELPRSEQEKTLYLLPDTEREQIEATLDAFARLHPGQRLVILKAFHRFASLTPGERAEFLRNADRWKEMSPADRATWRRLVTHLPPLPPGMFEPPLPPGAVVGPLGSMESIDEDQDAP